jgi:transposase InsO family protein
VDLLADHGVTYTAAGFRHACAKVGIQFIFGSTAHPQTQGYGKPAVM